MCVCVQRPFSCVSAWEDTSDWAEEKNRNRLPRSASVPFLTLSLSPFLNCLSYTSLSDQWLHNRRQLERDSSPEKRGNNKRQRVLPVMWVFRLIPPPRLTRMCVILRGVRCPASSVVVLWSYRGHSPSLTVPSTSSGVQGCGCVSRSPPRCTGCC